MIIKQRVYNVLLDAYCYLHPRKYIPNRFLSLFRFLIAFLADTCIKSFSKQDFSRIEHSIVRGDIVVSLTSFPARIDNVWKVISSLKLQQVKVGKIVLWLSLDQFNTIDILPQNLQQCQDDRFSIRLVDGDLRSHKKYFYAMQEYSESMVITVDDDIIYHPKTISHLLDVSSKYPQSIAANLTSRIVYDGNNIRPYIEWGDDNSSYTYKNLVQIGAGGVLYPPHCLNPMVLNKKVFMELAPRADDLWLNAMARIANTKIIQSPSSILFLPVFQSNKRESLSQGNVSGGGNDVQLNNIRSFFMETQGKDLYKDQNEIEFEA